MKIIEHSLLACILIFLNIKSNTATITQCLSTENKSRTASTLIFDLNPGFAYNALFKVIVGAVSGNEYYFTRNNNYNKFNIYKLKPDFSTIWSASYVDNNPNTIGVASTIINNDESSIYLILTDPSKLIILQISTSDGSQIALKDYSGVKTNGGSCILRISPDGSCLYASAIDNENGALNELFVFGVDDIYISFNHNLASIQVAKMRINLTSLTLNWSTSFKYLVSTDSIFQSSTIYSTGRNSLYSINLWQTTAIFTISVFNPDNGELSRSIITAGPSCTNVIDSLLFDEQVEVLAYCGSQYVLFIYNPGVNNFGSITFNSVSYIWSLAKESTNYRVIFAGMDQLNKGYIIKATPNNFCTHQDIRYGTLAYNDDGTNYSLIVQTISFTPTFSSNSMHDTIISAHQDTSSLIPSKNFTSDVSYNVYQQNYLNIPVNSVVNKTYELPCLASGNTIISYTLNTTLPNSVPSWAVFDLDTRSVVINTTGVITNSINTIRMDIIRLIRLVPIKNKNPMIPSIQFS